MMTNEERDYRKQQLEWLEEQAYKRGLEDASKICETMMHEGEWLAADIREFKASGKSVEDFIKDDEK